MPFFVVALLIFLGHPAAALLIALMYLAFGG
jgi:hypothetical protein